MPVPAHVVDDALAALRADGGEGEILTLLLPWGIPSAQRAGMLRAVGGLAEALRARGIAAHVMRVGAPDLERRGVDAGGVEALFVLYAGADPQLPPIYE